MTFMDWAVLMYYNGKLQKEAITKVGANLKKKFLNSDCYLKLDSMKLESTVIDNQTCIGEIITNFCTYCPSGDEISFSLKLTSSRR